MLGEILEATKRRTSSDSPDSVVGVVVVAGRRCIVDPFFGGVTSAGRELAGASPF